MIETFYVTVDGTEYLLKEDNLPTHGGGGVWVIKVIQDGVERNAYARYRNGPYHFKAGDAR